MPTGEIAELQQVFLSRLDTLSHLLDAGTRHLPDFRAALQQRLAPDMFPLGSQIAITCNQPRGFPRWCAGRPIHNLHLEVESLELARSYTRQTKDLVAALSADDSKLDACLSTRWNCFTPSLPYRSLNTLSASSNFRPSRPSRLTISSFTRPSLSSMNSGAGPGPSSM